MFRRAVGYGIRLVVGDSLYFQIPCNEENAFYLLRGELLAVGVGVEDCRNGLYQVEKSQAVDLVSVHISFGELLQCTVACKKWDENLSVGILSSDEFELYTALGSVSFLFYGIFADNVHIAFDERLQEKGTF